MRYFFHTAKSPIFTYQIEADPDYPPKKDRRSAREIFRQEVQK